MFIKEKIGSRQFTILVIFFTIGSSILISPSMLTGEARQDAWMASILGIVVGIGLVYLYQKLGARFPESTLVHMNEIILGKWLGKIVSLLTCFFFLLLASLVLRNIGDFMTSMIIPDTPIQFIHIIFLSISVIGIRLGIETIARAGEVFFPWLMLFIFIIGITLVPLIKLKHIQPIGENGVKHIILATYHFVGTPFLELIVLLMILPCANHIKSIGKTFVIGVLIAGVVLFLLTALSVLVMGVDITTRQIYPTYILAKKINVGKFLERLEVIVAGIWFLTIYFKLTLCFYAATLGLSQTFRLTEYKPLTLPLGMLIVSLSILVYPNITYFQNFASQSWPPFAFCYGFVLPVLLLITAKLRGLGLKG
ncbi:spore germination protein KB [Paenibacillus sp. yr247]|uniref:GerAB/ArcD/ProY family transporter n=1 Tax=Paenibacillus sp. yr247 TaxID=1761880 RepID=UPI00088DEA5B|nr:endospore germination permease [Paenibacillus sp. yr247]SDN03743.1 spore germination protein KB [Paenibacillus sp. yr247]